MKILHTADWHIGQTFFDYDRKTEHLHFFDWLKKQLVRQAIDVLLIAGDVFDSSNPSAESQRIFYAFLREITTENHDLQVIIIAGNHDSGARLEAPDPLLETMNVTVRGLMKRTPEGDIAGAHFILPLRHRGETAAWCIAAPYLRQGDYPPSETYLQGVEKLFSTLYEQIPDKTKPVIAMAHLFVSGSEISDGDRSERVITGGLEYVTVGCFPPQMAYIALGHLHRAQQVGGCDHIRYAGAPLPMSFAEKNNIQGVMLIEITDAGVAVERLRYDTPVRLLSIPAQPAALDVVFDAIRSLPDGEPNAESPFLEIKVLITEPEPSLKHRIEEMICGKAVRLARIAAVTQAQEHKTGAITCEQLQTISPVEMASDVFKRQFGGEALPDAMRTLLENVIREVESCE
ncbi:MAG: exonuclease SbcCD subunit D C-terminal domain-containing protein [Tannerella sp.]|jgi:exonuclease SbcD|nr:exonuclease SbcCD subunit D C-terminal domain-containing protein [Tannerella sp.]